MINWGFNWKELIIEFLLPQLRPPPPAFPATHLWGAHQGAFTWGLGRALCKPQSRRMVPRSCPGHNLYGPTGGPAGGGWALSLEKVRKAQKPGRQDLLGVNTASPLKIKFCSLRLFFIKRMAGTKPGSKLSSNWYGFVEKRGQRQESHTTMHL